MKKSIIAGLLALGVLIGAAMLVSSSWVQSKQAGGDPVSSSLATLERRDLSFSVSAAGEIGPSEQVSVRPEVNGRIQELPVDLGDRVKKGDILFTLDDNDLQIEKAARETEIEAAQLALEKAERNWKRATELFAAKLISQELYEDTRTEFEQAKNSLVRATQNLNLVKERLLKTRIAAPFDCTVLTRPVSIGQAVSGSGGFNSGTEVLTIADLGKMVINAHVNQADVVRLRTGQEVEIRVDSVPGLTMKGVVERIAPQSAVKNNVKGYPVRIGIPEPNEQVRPGMTANLSVPIASSANALAVPLAAVFTEQGERFVYVAHGGEFERRVVQIGIADYDYAEVLHGLSPGERVSLEDQGRHVSRTSSNAKTAGGKPAAGTNQAGGQVKTNKPAASGTNSTQR